MSTLWSCSSVYLITTLLHLSRCYLSIEVDRAQFPQGRNNANRLRGLY
ncbi:unnamed protein product [Amoebophrya sp. A25]|nr:unnamed protein product [Amoebophrya sp. A25]|eukprot:GSA25T00009505001.1